MDYYCHVYEKIVKLRYKNKNLKSLLHIQNEKRIRIS